MANVEDFDDEGVDVGLGYEDLDIGPQDVPFSESDERIYHDTPPAHIDPENPWDKKTN